MGLVNNNKNYYRWGNRPVDEAETFGHTQVVEYLKNYAVAIKDEELSKEENNEKNNNNSEPENSKPSGETPLL